jgi:hypothetical protein
MMLSTTTCLSGLGACPNALRMTCVSLSKQGVESKPWVFLNEADCTIREYFRQAPLRRSGLRNSSNYASQVCIGQICIGQVCFIQVSVS